MFTFHIEAAGEDPGALCRSIKEAGMKVTSRYAAPALAPMIEVLFLPPAPIPASC